MQCFSSYIFFFLIFNVTLCATNNSIHININHNHNTTYSPRQMLKYLVGWLTLPDIQVVNRGKEVIITILMTLVMTTQKIQVNEKVIYIFFFQVMFLYFEFSFFLWISNFSCFPSSSCTLLLMYDLNNFAFSL